MGHASGLPWPVRRFVSNAGCRLLLRHGADRVPWLVDSGHSRVREGSVRATHSDATGWRGRNGHVARALTGTTHLRRTEGNMDYAEMFSLKGKNAIIAGGAGGIGSEVAKGFATYGARVAIAGINDEKGERVAEEVRLLGAAADFFHVDVTQSPSVDEMVAKVKDAYGRIDILVCANGILAVEPSEGVTDEDWDRMLKVNLYGTFYLCRAVGRHMIAQGYGKIVNFSSTDAFLGVPNQASYCASKGGVNQLTRVLATDWIQYGINVNAVGPCDVDTPMTHQYLESPGYGKWIIDALPIGRVGQPSEMVGACVYLCSDAASLVVGHTLMVDGGRTVI